MRVLLMLLLALIVTELVESTKRHLQDYSFRYRANYSADFQHFTDPLCDGVPASVYVICHGPKLTILSTSDSTIDCHEVLKGKSENRTTFQCQNFCNLTECDSVYRYQSNNSDSSYLFGPFGSFLDGPFGSISFRCEGDSLLNVGAEFVYLKGGNTSGSCAAVVDGTTRRRNFHVARMGVSCPDGISRKYVYDDTYFDCMGKGTMTIDLTQDPAPDMFACVSGMICTAQNCSFPFEEIPIHTKLSNFVDTCVESSLDRITTYPTPAPLPSTKMYSAQFEASWAFVVEPLETSCTLVGSPPTLTVQCGNGATIQKINATDSMLNCQTILDNELSCFARNERIVNRFVSVFYECTGPEIPTSAVTYPQSEVSCDNNTESTLIRQAVTLGVFCENITTGSWYLYDAFLECAKAEHEFSKTIKKQYGVNKTRYTCSESASFAAGSLVTNTQMIPNVTIVTDDSWLIVGERYKECRISMPRNSDAPTPKPTTISAPIMSLTPVPATAAPTLSLVPIPATMMPISTLPIPSIQMTNVPSVPTMPIVSMAPVTSTPTITTPIGGQGIAAPPLLEPASDSSSFHRRAILEAIAGVLMGLALLAIVGWWLRRRRLKASMLFEKASSLPSTAAPAVLSPAVVGIQGDRNLSCKDQVRSVDSLSMDDVLATPVHQHCREASIFEFEELSSLPSATTSAALLTFSPTVVRVRGGRTLSFKDQIRSVEDVLATPVPVVSVAEVVRDASSSTAESSGI